MRRVGGVPWTLRMIAADGPKLKDRIVTPRSIKRTLDRLIPRPSRHRASVQLSSGLRRDDTPFVNLAWARDDGQQVIDLRDERTERPFFDEAKILPS